MWDYWPERGRYPAKCVLDGPAAMKVYRELKEVTGVKYQDNRLLLPAEPRLVEYAQLTARAGSTPSFQGWYQDVTRREKNVIRGLEGDWGRSPQHLKANLLYDYQTVGAEFLARVGRGILADDCGLGKTAQAVIGIELSGECSQVLVLCPKSVQSTWADEIAKWTQYDDTQVTIFDAAKRKKQLEEFAGGWAIVNLEQFRIEPGFLQLGGWDWLIVDEAHRISNRKTKTFEAVKRVRDQTKRCALLTGTPIGNSPAELWALLHMLYPQQYPSYWRFYDLYIEYVENPFFGGREIVGTKNENLLRRDLAPKMLMRRKEDVAKDLPPKTYKTMKLTMEPEQYRHYATMAHEMYIELTDHTKLRAANTMSMILRLRQVLSSPAAFDLPDVSSKLDAVLDIVQSTDRKVLVFTLFRSTVASILQRLEKAKIPAVEITGGVDSEGRDQAREALNTGDAKVLVATLGAGGVGLTLTGASVAVFVEKHYNPAHQVQAEDRIHRISQEKNVYIMDLLCPGTVDDLVEAILKKKLKMQNAILADALIENLGAFA